MVLSFVRIVSAAEEVDRGKGIISVTVFFKSDLTVHDCAEIYRQIHVILVSL